MSMGILPMTLTTPRPPQCLSLSSIRVLMGPEQYSISPNSAGVSGRPSCLIIRMGGGPRTYPGGVSKWQWKRMQAKKAKQLLQARLCRERQIYEMRKRAELKAAVSELERPWEVVERAPTLFSVKADEQVKVLADRFQKLGGFDMWSEKDGPQIFSAPDGLPSARFFPKGVVHSVKPYGVISDSSNSTGLDDSEDGKELQFNEGITGGKGGSRRRSRRTSIHGGKGGSEDEGYSEIIDLVPSRPVAEGSYSNSRNLRFSSAYKNKEGNAMESKRVSRKNDHQAFYRGRGTKSSSYGTVSHSNSEKVEGERISRGNAHRDFYEARYGEGSSYSSSRNHGNGRRQGSDSDSNGVNMSREERRRRMGGGRYNSSNRWFDTGKLSSQAKDSHDDDAYRRRNWKG